MVPKVHTGIEMDMARNESGTKNIKNMKKRMHIFCESLTTFPCLACKTTWKVGREDPRRVIHAFKVGSSLTLVSLLYLLEPLFKGIGQHASWAVMTVVVVFEFTAGETLCKGLNRAYGTLLAGVLAFLLDFVANSFGQIFQAVFIGVAVFIIGSAATYMRFIPCIQKNYDYGVVIFLSTFNLLTVSSYRVDHHVLKIARDRFYTIVIGCGVCLLMSLLVFPNWSGKDLHNSTASKLEGLAKSLEACVNEFFYGEMHVSDGDVESSENTIYEGYNAVLDSKSTDETLALHASREPRFSRYCHKFPWQQYVKLGTVLRQFGYTLVALHGCLRTEIQTPGSFRVLFKDPCIRLAAEVSKVLIELANSIKSRRHCSPEILSDHLHEALKDLDTAIKSQPRLFLGSNDNQSNNILAATIAAAQAGTTRQTSKKEVVRSQVSKLAITSLEFSEALPFAAFASLLLETVVKLDLIVDEVEELGRLACFTEYTPGDEFSVSCEKPRVDVLENNLRSHGGE